ncbi:FomB family phosphonate monophosphate kinase [Nonomuraea sp. NPDC046802]|uniref:FomB family phosphonate monophosphate kinase n=1 Tax=Nonomuraea sp. NPDC046802 TaxID=3154919 RepID=UPI00340A5776
MSRAQLRRDLSRNTPGYDINDALRDMQFKSAKVLDLNVLRARLRFNSDDSPAYGYFSQFASPDATVDFEFTCVDLDQDPLDEAMLARLSDSTIRSKRFRSGYFRGAYFGDPAYLVTRGRHWYVFGRSLEKIVWPYLVKQALNVFALESGYLHLKAAALGHPDGGVTLLVGQAGSGKSIFLVQACQNGARFITNTHTMLRDGIAYGIPSALRVRNDECFGGLIEQRNLAGHLVGGEFLASPDLLFSDATMMSGRVRNIVLMNYQDNNRTRFERISPEKAILFLEQFALGVTVYDLRYDLIEHLDRDVEGYVSAYERMKVEIAALCRGSRCYLANVRMQDPDVRTAVLDELSAA